MRWAGRRRTRDANPRRRLARILPPLALLGVAVAACGSAAASGGVPNAFRNGNLTAGTVVSVSGTTLVLSTSNGSVTVSFSASTPISETGTGSAADITVGSCITATGSDASGTMTANRVTVSPQVDGSCPAPSFTGGGFAGGRPDFTFGPRPSGGFTSDFASVRGVVTAVSGSAVTVTPSSGSTQAITVPGTATVSTTTSGSTSDLVAGACVAAVGPRSSSGTVDASSLLLQPAGPSGCFSGGSGFGGYGGGGFGGFAGGGGGSTTT
jgi:hypothetical protein